MKWIDKRPLFCDTVVKRFAWKPLRLGQEIHWLEFVYMRGYYWKDNRSDIIQWIPKQFISKEEYRTRKER